MPALTCHKAAPCRPLVRPFATRPTSPGCPRRATTCHSITAGCGTTEEELLAAISSLGYPGSIFPGDEQLRTVIDKTIGQLEEANPTPSPLAQPDAGGHPSPLLVGDWKLVYASSGTYVTRTPFAQALLAASRLPGIGVADIQQSLELTNSQLRTSNAACFGLGPFGDWEVCIKGTWQVQDAVLARVVFDGYALQLVGILGAIKLPRMAKVSLPIKNGRAADFYTTYLSERLRIARGAGRNLFVFTRLA